MLYMNTFSFNQKTPKEIDKMIAERIRNIRKRRKLSQEKLSEKSGVSLGFTNIDYICGRLTKINKVYFSMNKTIILKKVGQKMYFVRNFDTFVGSF